LDDITQGMCDNMDEFNRGVNVINEEHNENSNVTENEDYKGFNVNDREPIKESYVSENKFKRVTTGIIELDELISGGLPTNSITLISGAAGSGKSIMCFQYMWEGLNKGERCLYLTSDERIESSIKQANELGFNFKQWMEQDKLKFLYLDLDKNNIHKEIQEEIRTGGYSRIALDSLTPFSELPVWVSGVHEITPSEDTKPSKYPTDSLPATRLHIRRIISLLNKENCTAIVTSEIPENSRNLSRDTISEFIVDGIILLDLDTTMDRRKLTVRKMRATKHSLKPQDITITQGGIKFL
jgi:circadian clock protein KaiC